jgi:diguanylate cyclase (GGDEF)-like protein/PAS domain S-box-containing protein
LSSRELLQANDELRGLFQAFPDLLLRVGRDGVVLDVKRSDALEHFVPRERLVGRRIQELGLGELSEGFDDAVAGLRGPGSVVSLAYSLPVGAAVEHYEARLVPSPADEVLVIVRNVTERREANERIRHGASLLRSTLESTADGILVIDLEGRLVLNNRRYEEIWGYSPEWLARGDTVDRLDRASRQLRHPEQFLDKIRELVGNSESEACDELEFLDGRLIERYSAPHRLDGVPIGRVWSFRDVTARRRAEERLVHEAIHDALTGLPNRTLLIDRVGQALNRAKRVSRASFALLFVDFDRFKTVNDSLGHAVGDELLCAAATRLAGCVRPGDTVARLGGDELAILVEDIERESDAVAVAERVLAAIAEPFALRGHEVFATASIGIAAGSLSDGDPQELLRAADVAMYQVKRRGGSGYEVFQPGMHTIALARLEIETDLRRALDRDELVLHYQPIVELASGETTGFEALVRWNHPQKGLIYPAEFIPIAEETGMILPIGAWVLERACGQMQEWIERFPESAGLTISVNVSARQLTRSGWADSVVAALRRTGLAPGNLALELTETVLMETRGSSTGALEHLHRHGVRIHLDDFGTGYSSLGYLHELPIDALKIDRSFVARLGEPGESAEIIRTMMTLAGNLGIDVIAEGIETIEQAERLIGLGCTMGQGYHYARPADVEATGVLIARGGTRRAVAPVRGIAWRGGGGRPRQPARAQVAAGAGRPNR